MKLQMNIIKLFSILILLSCSTFELIGFEHNLTIYTDSGQELKAELLEMNEIGLLIDNIKNDQKSRFVIKRNKISRIFIEDDAMHGNGTKIHIQYKTRKLMNREIKGIDFENNILYIDSVYINLDFEYVHKRDSLDLSDTNIVRIIIDPKSPFFNGLVQKPFYGFLSGAVVGGSAGLFTGIAMGEIIITTFSGGVVGGVLGSAIGLVVGIGYIFINLDNDISYRYQPNMKYLLLRYIYYPEVKYDD